MLKGIVLNLDEKTDEQFFNSNFTIKPM